MPLNICVYTISKNEEKHCERWVKSCAGADGLYVLDTGSTDNTVTLLQSLGVNVSQQTFSPWRFDTARNAALDRLPQECDIAIVLDMDEVLCDGWRKIVEDAWLSNTTTTELRHLYAWSPEHVFQNSRVHARNSYKWIKPVHEVQVHVDGKPFPVFIPNTLVIHLPDGTKSRSQYLDLLRISTEENPQDARNSIYYIRELSFYNEWVNLIKEAHRYLHLPEAIWGHERSFAYRLLAKAHKATGSQSEVEKDLLKACSEEPNSREAWYSLGEEYRLTNQFLLGYACAMRALSIIPKPNLYLDNPAVWSHAVYDLASVCGYYSNHKPESLVYAKLAMEANPSDQRLIDNYNTISKLMPV